MSDAIAFFFFSITFSMKRIHQSVLALASYVNKKNGMKPTTTNR